MKKIVLLAALLPLVSVNAQKTELKTFEDSVAYAIGCDVAGGVKQMNIDYNMLIQGIADFSKNKNLFSPNDVKNILTEYQIRQQKGAHRHRPCKGAGRLYCGYLRRAHDSWQARRP